MPRACGKYANNLRVDIRERVGQPSTHSRVGLATIREAGVKLKESHRLYTLLSTYFSPRKNSFLPLSEHYFYPVSTAPINYYSQLKIQER